ncbi:MAG: hypothetical protein A2W20_00155 [Candidatus Aminicenantes bacterium RBG_16_66_30]|nr:MAG: hypothetical protein A2W20_00155 [Candidatus Aminicenantes bacterium RBG_16_66_30]
MGQLRLLGEPAGSDDHATLANLAFPQAGHTGFVAAAGLAGGQTIIGGTAASENLSLQSTAHAARGYVRAQDDLQLLSNIIRDAAGVERLKLATASPHLTLYGDALIYQKRLAAGPSAGAIATDAAVLAKGTAGVGQAGLKIEQGLTLTVPATESWGLGGTVNYGANASLVAGLYFQAYWTGSPGQVLTDLAAISAFWYNAGYTGSTLTNAKGLWIKRPGAMGGRLRPTNCAGVYVDPLMSVIGSGNPTLIEGIHLEDPSGALGTPATVIGLKINDIGAGTNRYLLELGPATPNLRLMASAPAADLSQLWLAVNNGAVVLRQVAIGAADSGGAGYRTLRILN